MKRTFLIILILTMVFSTTVCYADSFNDCWWCVKCNGKTNPVETVCSQCGDAMPQLKVRIDVDFKGNLIFSKFDVNVYLDDILLERMEHGIGFKRIYRMNPGIHTIKFEKADETTVTVDRQFEIMADSDLYWEIKTSWGEIVIDKEECKDLGLKYDVAFDYRINMAGYSIAFDMDTHRFIEVEDYTSHDKVKNGTFSGSFHDDYIVLNYSDGTVTKMRYVYEDLNYQDTGYYLYPLSEYGTIKKNSMQFRNYKQINSYDYKFNE